MDECKPLHPGTDELDYAPDLPPYKVGWCRLTASKPVLKAPVVSALETRIS